MFLLLLLLTTVGVSWPGYAQETPEPEPQTLVLWSVHFLPAMVERQRALIAQFEAANPHIEVRFVVMDETFMDQLMQLNARTGTLPDVVLHPLHLTYEWYDQVLLDTQRTTSLIESLGAETFSPSVLSAMRTDNGQYRAIPSDGWAYLLLYRTDLFAENDLAVPDSFDAILDAAAALHDPENGFYGFCGPNTTQETYTTHVVEHFALSNGARLLDESNNLALNSPAFAEAIDFYATLLQASGPPERNWGANETRSAYLAGNCGMTIWSPLILDELAGLWETFAPTCEQCVEEPDYLARNTGVVTQIQNAEDQVPPPLSRAAIMSLGVLLGASPAVETFVAYYYNESYIDWLSLAPETKLPLRSGTPDQPNAFLEGWRALQVGIDQRMRLSDIYGDELMVQIEQATAQYGRFVGRSAYPRVPAILETDPFVWGELFPALQGRVSAEHAALRINITTSVKANEDAE
ncbi:MAG: extracellular solute-binding protein [Chloroflexi bacterium]|nr:extracellular solute-binding protein [Chloroflexota bacterium]